MRPTRPVRPTVLRPVGAPLLRGTLVGGAAYAAGKSRARTQADQAARDQVAGTDDVASKLARLGEMIQQGLLTPTEFAAAKAKILS
ncbi:SHOCT domain-containing protein [Streptacidiphilus sp. MAP5-52]